MRPSRRRARKGGPHGPGVLIGHVRNAGLDRIGTGSLLVLLTVNALAWPGLRLESLLFGRGPRQPEPAWGPLFILGHYRSGTTLLHKLLAADPRLASLTTFDVLFPGCPGSLQPILRPPIQWLCRLFGVRHRYFHEYGLRLDDPNETEAWWLAAGFPWSSYWGYLLPRRSDYLDRWIDPSDPTVQGSWIDAYEHAVRRIRRRHGGRPLVVKDPPNTARAALLAERFPRARFIHIVRDPARVLLSMWRLWRDTVEPLFGLQRVTDAERCDRIAAHYSQLLSGYERDRPQMGDRLVELRYEDLVDAPIEEIRMIYRTLGLGGFAAARAAVARRLEEDRDYREAPVAGEVLPDELAALAEHWRPRLGYGAVPSVP